MPSSRAPTARRAQAERLAQRIQAHKEEATLLRAEFGDPQQALFQFLCERFETPALITDERAEPGAGGSLWEDADELNAR
jgi:hypothetical protein